MNPVQRAACEKFVFVCCLHLRLVVIYKVCPAAPETASLRLKPRLLAVVAHIYIYIYTHTMFFHYIYSCLAPMSPETPFCRAHCVCVYLCVCVCAPQSKCKGCKESCKRGSAQEERACPRPSASASRDSGGAAGVAGGAGRNARALETEGSSSSGASSSCQKPKGKGKGKEKK